MGSIYKRGRIWWIRYSKGGKDYWESARSRKKSVAAELLKLREGDLTKGEEPGITYEKVKFEELVEDLKTDYRHNKRKSMERVEMSLKHLEKHFAGFRVPKITTSEVKPYIQTRLSENAQNGTVNRELAAVKRMLRLGYQDKKVSRVPFIPMLREHNVRQGSLYRRRILR